MIQADLRTARMHPDYGMNGFILAAIVIAALAALGGLMHVMEGLFFLRRASSSFVRFVSVWDIAFAFVGYLTCAAGLSRHRIFPWLYVAFAIGFSVPRILLEIQAQGVDVGMSAMHEDESFLQETHIMQALALLTWLAAIYVAVSPAVRITYRNRLTRDEERLVEQLQGVDPRLSLGPQGRDRYAEAAHEAGRDRPAAPDGHRPMRLPAGGTAAAEAPAGEMEDETVLVRRRARAAAATAGGSEPLPALPSFFRPDAAAPAQDGGRPPPRAMAGSAGIGADADADADADARAAALAAATVAGALQRVSAEGGPEEAASLPSPSLPSPGLPEHVEVAAARPAAPAGEEEPVIVRSGRRRKDGAQPLPPPAAAAAVPPQERSAAVGSIIANAQRRPGEPAPASAQWADAGASAMAASRPPVQEIAFASAARSDERTEAPLLADTAAAGAAPEPPATWPAGAGAVQAAPEVPHDEPARRQLAAEAERQKLQEELEIDRRIARLRGLASGQVSALSIGLAMDRNPLADDDEQEPMASDGAVRSTTDERLGRLRAAAAPPRSRGDSVRRREDQSLSENVSGAVHSLATGEEEGETPPTHGSSVGPTRGPGAGALDGGFQSRIDALLSRADASNAWHGGSLPDDIAFGQVGGAAGDPAAGTGLPDAEPDAEPQAMRGQEPQPAAQPAPARPAQPMPDAGVPPHLETAPGHRASGPAGAAQAPAAAAPEAALPPAAGIPGLAAAVPFDELPPPAGLPPAAEVAVPTPAASAGGPPLDARPEETWPEEDRPEEERPEQERPADEPPAREPRGDEPAADQPPGSQAGRGHAADLDAVFGRGGTGQPDAVPAAGEVPGLAPPLTPEPAVPAVPAVPAAAMAAPQAEAVPPQAEPVDEAELARSLADILPAAAGPLAGSAGGSAGGPAGGAAAGTAAAPGDGAADGDGGPGTEGAAEGQGAAAGEGRAAGEGPDADADPYVAQRIEAMRILVDEGFMSAEEFARRSAELQAGG